MKLNLVLNVADLPTYAFGHRSILWWGTVGFCLIEATAFGLALVAYLYLRSKAVEWPPNVAPPPLLWGTLNTGVLLASCVPNHFTKKAGEDENLHGVWIWLLVSIAFGLVFSALRGFEFASLNVQWDTNAYGSIVWALLALHTTHIGTDLADTMDGAEEFHKVRSRQALCRC